MSASVTIATEIHADAAHLTPAGELTIYSAAELRQTLLELITPGRRRIDIDLSQVTEIDTAGLQVLMAGKQSARADGIALGLLNHSACVLDLIEIYDLAGWLGDPLLLPASGAARAA